MKGIPKSPFKFLDAFEKEDKDLFFGREDEVEQLYDLTFDTRLIVFFGASGTGKTSLIHCGLANKFSETRWQELSIRRNNNINQAILDQLNIALQHYPSNQSTQDPIDGLQLLYRFSSKPIFITFDQFEELFILNPSRQEQEQFFQFLHTLLHTPLPCKVILVIREEFVAHLWDYEYILPTIFDHRFRIKQLQSVQIKKIIEKTLTALEAQGKIKVEKSDQVSALILEKLDSGKTGIALTYLQVYLDRLFRKAALKDTSLPVFDVNLISEMGTIEDVIDDFLDEQLLALDQKLGKDHRAIPLKILGAMVSDERTKKVLELEDLETLRQNLGLTIEEINTCLLAFESMRILNRYESSEKQKFELSHDIIAEKIWGRLPEADKQLRLIKKSLVQRLEDYEQEKGSLLGSKELISWEDFFDQLDLNEAENAFIDKSRNALEEAQRKEKERTEREIRLQKERLLEQEKSLEIETALRKKAELSTKRARRRMYLFISAFILAAVLAFVSFSQFLRSENLLSLLMGNQIEQVKEAIYRIKYESAENTVLNILQVYSESSYANDNSLRELVIELVYFYSESDQFDKAIALLMAYEKSADLSALTDVASISDYIKQHYALITDKLEGQYYPSMVQITGGRFIMGCADELPGANCELDEMPPHEVELDAFQIASSETTVWQFALYCAANGIDITARHSPIWGLEGDNPATMVSWIDALHYINWFNGKSGLQKPYLFDPQGGFLGIQQTNSAAYALPTEAQWEYAAKAGQNTLYSGSDHLDSIAWYGDNSDTLGIYRTHPVMKKLPNAFGLFDMTGNVGEWCQDWYLPDYYQQGDQTNPTGPSEGEGRVIRGGDWNEIDANCRNTNRSSGNMDDRTVINGFRVVKHQ